MASLVYREDWARLYCGDCLEGMRGLPGESVDLLATDPPYGISFMGKDWDRALPEQQIWRECLRVLKPGAFAFVMSIPRADCLSRMIISLEDAGFRVDFTPIFWAYASGFPKAQNIGKAVDKRLGAEREVIGKTNRHMGRAFGEGEGDAQFGTYRGGIPDLTIPSSPQAKALDGSYGGFQPKPAVEVIIVAMKPLSERNFVDQALKNRKGITWLDDGRMPYESDDKPEGGFGGMDMGIGKPLEHQDYRGCQEANSQGRFPANLIVSDDVLNDGRVRASGTGAVKRNTGKGYQPNAYGTESRPVGTPNVEYGDSGSFSRYFDLDKWWEKQLESMSESVKRTFPFLIVPKASKSEKNRGIGVAVPRTEHGSTPRKNATENKSPNYHPTCKPVKLMAYLITLGSRPGDLVLDPFIGSGTTGIAAKMLGRRCLGYEIDEGYCRIAAARCCYPVQSRGI